MADSAEAPDQADGAVAKPRFPYTSPSAQDLDTKLAKAAENSWAFPPDTVEAMIANTDRLRAARMASLIPARFAGVSFDDYRPQTDSQTAALEAAKRWVAMAADGQGVMLALVGETGAGKSHLLYSAALDLLGTHRETPYLRPWYRLAGELRFGGRNAFAPQLHEESHEVRERLWRHRIVLIDEVRPTAATAFDDTELAKFACHAYDNLVSVLITTNVSPLESVMGPAAASRFTQVVVIGPDWRQRA